MEKIKIFYTILSCLSLVFGALVLGSTKIDILGDAIRTSQIPLSTNISFGVFFIVMGVILLALQFVGKE